MPLDAVLVVTDTPAGPAGDGGPGPSTTQMIHSPKNWSWTWEVGKSDSGSYQVTGPDAALVTPGGAPGGCREVAMSLDGGAHADGRMLSNGASLQYELPPYVQEQGTGLLGEALAQAPLHRWTAQQVTLQDVINGELNQIRTQDPGGIIAPGGILPDMRGIARARIGLPGSQQAARLAATFVVDAAVQNLVLDIDANRDNLLSALEHVVERMGNATDPELAQFVIDSGDFGVDGVTPRSVTLGHQDSASRFTFDGVSEEDVNQPVLRGTNAQAQVTDMCASVSLLGGSTRHGLPDGATLTGLVTLNNRTSDATGNYRSGLPVLACYVNRDQGGVFFYPGDGAYHPMSQAMGVRDLWYDEITNLLYAATDDGVWYHSSDPGDTGRWGKLGGMSHQVEKVRIADGELYCLLTVVSDGSTHLAHYTRVANNTGMSGWRIIHSTASIVDFVVMGGKVYFFTQGGTSGKVYVWPLAGGASVTVRGMRTSGVDNLTPTIEGLDAVTAFGLGHQLTGMYIRTSDGSEGLYYVPVGSVTAQDANDGTLARFGARVKVNKITQNPNQTVEWSTGSTAVRIWAATDVGVFASASDAGRKWKRTDGQSALGGVDVLMVASAPPRRWLGRLLTRVYAITTDSLWVSHNGTIHWHEVNSQLLDAGPVFAALWRGAHGGEYPDNVAATLAITGADGNPYELWRELDESTGAYTYTLYNMQSTAPAGAHRFAEVNQLSLPALLDEEQASALLLDAKARLLGLTRQAQQIIEVHSMFESATDPLRFLRPTHWVTVSAALEMCLLSPAEDAGLVTLATYDNVGFKVLRHTISVSEQEPGMARTVTRLGIYLLENRSDPSRLVGDLFYAGSRSALYARGA